jgi:hypothetical protein
MDQGILMVDDQGQILIFSYYIHLSSLRTE